MTPFGAAVETKRSDAIDEGVHTAKRAMRSVRHGIEQIQDLKDEAAYRVKRQPLTAIALAASAGLVFGAAIGWVSGRFSRT